MEALFFGSACILYSGIYLAYLVKGRRVKAAIGTGMLVVIAAAGFAVLLLGRS